MKNERRIEILAVIKSQREAGGPVTCESVLADLAVLDQVESGAPAPARPAASPQGGASTAPLGAGAAASGSRRDGKSMFRLQKTFDNRADGKRGPLVAVMLTDEMDAKYRVGLFDPKDAERAVAIPDGSEVMIRVYKTPSGHLNGEQITPVIDRHQTPPPPAKTLHEQGRTYAEGMGHPDIPV